MRNEMESSESLNEFHPPFYASDETPYPVSFIYIIMM